jgi:hypothetical protein
MPNEKINNKTGAAEPDRSSKQTNRQFGAGDKKCYGPFALDRWKRHDTVTHKDPDSNENRVVPLRPGIRIPRNAGQSQKPVEDLTKYERTDETEDFRHRMMVNAAGLAFVILLAFIGVWLADRLAEMRRNQDCVLSGRRNCAVIEATAPVR